MNNNIQRAIHVTRPLLPSLDKMHEKLAEIWGSQWITYNGFQHQKLESQLNDYLVSDNLSLFNNRTLALLLGLKALELAGEVIINPFTFAATLQSLYWTGLTP